ncbi:MAG: hypothetical protein ACKOFG_00595 [Limnohabitans sp.]
MGETKQGMAAKLENVFLEILRFVILLVLAISLVAAAVLGVYGVRDLGASESAYQPEKVDNKALMEELKKSLESNPATTAPEPAQKKSSPGKADNPLLEEELGKQLKAVADFLGHFDRNLTNPDGFKASLRKKAMALALEPSSEASVLDYAKGQTAFFLLAFADQTIVDALKKNGEDETLNSYFRAAIDLYPNFFERQQTQRKEFEAQEDARVMAAKAGAMMKIYIAGGLFGTFLLISLLLVLVKIERNLRAKPL